MIQLAEVALQPANNCLQLSDFDENGEDFSLKKAPQLKGRPSEA